MIRRPPRSTRTATRCPDTTLFRSRRDDLVGEAAHRQLVEHPRLLVGPHQPVDRQQRRKQGRDPYHPAARATQQRCIGTDGKWKCGRNEQEKQHWQPQCPAAPRAVRSEEHTSELQSLMRISYAVFCLKQKTKYNKI